MKHYTSQRWRRHGRKIRRRSCHGHGFDVGAHCHQSGAIRFGTRLSLSHDSGAGNGPFGFGWSRSLPSITSKTDKGLPQYHDPGSESLENLPIGVDGTAYQWTDLHGAVVAMWQVMAAATQTTVSSDIDSGSLSDER